MKTYPLEERYETLKISRDGRKLTITMNRPDFLNAADTVLHEELAHVFYDVAVDPDSDIIILTGAGRAFSAGGDIPWMRDAIAKPGNVRADRPRGQAHRLLHAGTGKSR